MPYKSKAQRAYMHAKLPKIAAQWDAEYGGKIQAGSVTTGESKLAKSRKPASKRSAP